VSYRPGNQSNSERGGFTARRMALLSAILLAASTRLTSAQGPFPFQNPNLAAEDRITDLLQRMTLDEKIDALSTNPTVPRLGIVGTGHVEGLHGLALGGPGGWEGRGQTVIPTTTFPQARGLGQTWDPGLLQQVAAQEAYETAYASGKYHRGGRVVRAPNADLSRDPRWGRNEESYGEDPLFVGTMATAYTRGLQGQDPHFWATASLLKHFLANSNEDTRTSSSSDFDERLFREYYSVPFRMAIQLGHANAMMTAYNAWNGTPMEVNPVLRAVVMKEWGFNGILCTDGGALTTLIKDHHAFPDLARGAAASINAGINQFLDDFRAPVHAAIEQHLVTEDQITQNLRGVFRVMLRLGMLDRPSTTPYGLIGADAEPGADPWWSLNARVLARKATDESIVLLKNTAGLLPLKQPASIAVIGPLADTVALDWYSGTPPFVVTPLAGIRGRAGGATVTFSDGKDIESAAALARTAAVAIVIVGNHPTCGAGWLRCPTPSDGKEAVDRKTLQLAQEDLVKAVLAANPKTVVVLQASFPYTTNWTEEHAPAILEITHNSEEQGDGLADVLFGDYNPAGRLTQTWVRDESQLPPLMDYDIRHGRTYMYLESKPLYPFGYGLSYTTFRYTNLQLSSDHLDANGTLTAKLLVTNTGGVDGDEVVQLYAAQLGSKIARPRQQLAAFSRIHLKAGESRQVTFQLPASELSYWNEKPHSWELDHDYIELRVGASSEDIRLRKTLESTGGVIQGQPATFSAHQ
jgi:beta-glucosidase